MYVYVLAHCTLRTNSLDVSSYITRLMYNIGVRTTQQRELKDNHHHLPRAPSRPGAGNAIPCLPSRKYPSFLWSRLHGSDERAHKTNWETRGHVHQPSTLAAYFLCAGSTRTIICLQRTLPYFDNDGRGRNDDNTAAWGTTAPDTTCSTRQQRTRQHGHAQAHTACVHAGHKNIDIEIIIKEHETSRASTAPPDDGAYRRA